MKNLIRHITVFIITSLAFSCNNDFLTEETERTFLESASIVISPDWDAQDYEIYCPGVGNAKFKITHAPDWLKISTRSGQFTNGFATLNCKANTHHEFSEIGIYYSYMTLSVEGKGNQTILIAYLTEGDPVVETESSMTVYYYFQGWLSFKNAGNGILLLSILYLPEWLSLDNGIVSIEEYPTIVLPPDGEETIYFLFNQTVPFSENLSGKIVMITNDKNRPVVEVDVQLDMGNPTLRYYFSDNLDFGRRETTKEIRFSNQGSGLLVWEIEGCPEWLSVSESNGSLLWDDKYLTFTCNREQVSSGVNSTTIYLKTNDKNTPSYPIAVSAQNHTANPENIKPITGNITDAYYDKQSDIMFITTTQPNRLLAYDTKNRTIARELSLNNASTRFRLSEDGHKAIIGQNGFITVIDMENFEIIKTIEVNSIVHDIEWANDDWCCYTERGHWSYLYWVNLNTNETSRNYGIYGEGCVLYKIPAQNYILVAEVGISSGVYTFDIDTKEMKNEFRNYFGNFWVSEDGTYIFTGSISDYYGGSCITKTSSFLDNVDHVPCVGWFSPSFYWAPWIDHHAASHSVWVLVPSDFEYSQQRDIIQYDANDYKRIKTYYYDDSYNDNLVRAHYVFANKAGTELVVIRNVTTGDATWSLEFIPIED